MFCCKKNSFCIGMLLSGGLILATALLINRCKKKEAFKEEYINKDIYDNEEYQKQEILEKKFAENPELKQKINQFNSKRLYNDDDYIE